MSSENKAANAAEKIKGKAKEAAGKATGNERLQAEGKADQVKGDAKQAVEKAKDALTD
ncbi:CsbD family protein [Streptacidiphilus albus]|uniref:CsbD family protein n=1 Tax=Streptacidiphilus albus TaxID=105425 RepID=UPI0007C84B8E|nr:CsbD family protein [Streptacidiphilus albus]